MAPSQAMTAPQNEMLVVGASGVVGAAAVEHFARSSRWRVTALSRRRPVVPDGLGFDHLPVDLMDGEACATAVAGRTPFTHLIYAAVDEAPGRELVQGWRDPERISANGQMFENILHPVAARGGLQHMTLLQGTKAYGAHLHDVQLPLKEDRPRDEHENFYWLHEDRARALAQTHGFAVTVFRPQIVLGGAPGAAMNPVAPIGAYAALCRELDVPFSFPTGTRTLCEVVDASLLAEAFAWATDTEAAHGEIFNVTNGDAFVLKDAWPQLADALGLTTVDTGPASMVRFFNEPHVLATWERLAVRHDLREPSLPALLGQSHHYLDLLLSQRLAERPVPIVVSTIKIRQAGFSMCRDSTDTMIGWLRRMEELRLLPPSR